MLGWLTDCRERIGLPEGSSACLLGLICGIGLLAVGRYISQAVVDKLLAFPAASFFT